MFSNSGDPGNRVRPRTNFLNAIMVGVGQNCWLNVVPLCTCARQNFDFHTSSLWEQMFFSQRCTRHLLSLISNPRGHQHSLSLGTDQVCNAVPCLPHDNIVGNRLYVGCRKSILLVVCHNADSSRNLVD